jgi:pyruvate dehydrogenase E1 component beta subunit
MQVRADTSGKLRQITYADAIREAIDQVMHKDPDTYVMGLGATDPKGVFGTTIGLEGKYGSGRVFDMPVSENAMTGIAVGSCIKGMRPIMAHQRADFMLMAMDQVINNAAKWYYMYGGQKSVPLTIRAIVGRGWGQGPQHSQNFQAVFAQIPGLKVVAPTTPYEAKGLLTSSVEDNNPVIFIEHRWLYNQVSHVPQGYYSLPLGKANILRKGTDITVVASMEMALEAVHVAEKLEFRGVSIEVLDICSVKPLDEDAILGSIAKTHHILIIDSSWVAFGVSSEIAAMVAEKGFDLLKAKIKRLGLPDVPTPSSPGLSKFYYTSEADICNAVCEILKINLEAAELGLCDFVNDVPDDYFKGPF